MKTHLCRFITFTRNGYKLRFYPSSLTAALWINPKERITEELFLSGLVKTDDLIIDIGANIGTISLAIASKVQGKCEIHAVEPHPTIYKYLKNNIKLNRKSECIKTHCMALGETSGNVFFTNCSDDTNNALNKNGDIIVKIQKLDTLIKTKRQIALLKIDVEGYEYQVLKGAQRILMQSKTVYLECIPEILSKNNSSEISICELLEQAGFSIYYVDGKNIKPNVIGSHNKKMLLAKRDAYVK